MTSSFHITTPDFRASASQDPKDAATPEELAAMEAEISKVRDEISAAKAEYKTLSTTLSTLESTLTTTDLRESVHALELTRKELLARLEPLRSGNVSPVSAAEKEMVDNEWRKAQRDAFGRKRIFDDFWGLLKDSLPEEIAVDDLAVSTVERHVAFPHLHFHALVCLFF